MNPMTSDKLREHWQSRLEGKNGAFMIQPSHRKAKIEQDIGTGNIPALSDILDEKNSFIVEAYIRLDDRSIAIHQQNHQFKWVETILAEIDGETKVCRRYQMAQNNGYAFDWVEIWKAEESSLHVSPIKRYRNGYFDGIIKQERRP